MNLRGADRQLHLIRLTALTLTGLVLLVMLQPVEADERGAGAWHRVVFDGRISAADRLALDEAGARAVQYVPHDAYVAWLDAEAAATVGALDRVAEARPLEAADKLDPMLRRAMARGRLGVQVYGGALAATLAAFDRIGEVTLHRPAQPDGALVEVLLSAPPAAAARLAALPGVRYVGPATTGPAALDEMSDQIIAGNREGGARPEPGYEDWLEGVDLSGEGVRISLVDTGIDPHPDFQDRVVAKVEYSRTVAEPLDVGHGTHVAGIVGGNPTDFPGIGRVRDSNGHLYGLGVAPQVELVDQNALSVTASALLCNVIWPPPDWGWERLTQDALDEGASVYNASWWTCEAQGGGYIASARTFDILARNADWRTTDTHEPFTFVFAAGNAGPAGANPTIASPGEAKNLITVAAATNARSPWGGGLDVAGFSSRGPAVDGRVVPTVIAPGANIMSTRAFTATAVCGDFPVNSYALYASCSGTSMAAPHVTGSVALLTEWWRRDHAVDGEDPSPAMTRALLVNTAEPLRPGMPVPDRQQGWGRIHLGNLFDSARSWVVLDEDMVFTDAGQTHTLTVRAADPTAPFRVTLAWSDAPGAAGANPALVNDLDLRVESSDGGVWLGNVLEDSWSVTGGAPDPLNNVENVFLREAGSASYTITITAHNLPGAGVPAHSSLTSQDFALVVSNATVKP